MIGGGPAGLIAAERLAQAGLAWAPWRSTAAWYLWRAADEGKKIKHPGTPTPSG